MDNLELVLDARATLGEGPSWDAGKGLLYWVDIMESQIHIFDPGSGTDLKYEIGQYVGAVVPDRNNGFVIAARDGFFRFDPASGLLHPIGDPEAGIAANRFNDGKCDAKGRFWAGTMELTERSPGGALYCLYPNGEIEKKVSGITCSNGITWSPDHTTMYYIDSPTKQVKAYPFDHDTGRLGEGRVIITIPEGEGSPDGMTTDMEGMLWIAQWDGYCVSRFNPETGERLLKVEVPAARVTSCVFGGDLLDELYITTARTGLPEEELRQRPLSGGIFRLKPGVQGLPSYSFGS
ncbi:SMP-30/gluconolactonase/LRE family protein [Paenibacillus sepulcri]